MVLILFFIYTFYFDKLLLKKGREDCCKNKWKSLSQIQSNEPVFREHHCCMKCVFSRLQYAHLLALPQTAVEHIVSPSKYSEDLAAHQLWRSKYKTDCLWSTILQNQKFWPLNFTMSHWTLKWGIRLDKHIIFTEVRYANIQSVNVKSFEATSAYCNF